MHSLFSKCSSTIRIPSVVLDPPSHPKDLVTCSTSRNRNPHAQILLGDTVQKLNRTVRLHDARHYCLPDGVPAVSDGYPDLSHLHRELLLSQSENSPQVGRQRGHDQPGAQAAAVQPGPTAAAGGD